MRSTASVTSRTRSGTFACRSLDALEAAGGGELRDQPTRPAKIRALHSSAVLAINVFQYFERRGGSGLPGALGCDGTLAALGIERPFDSGLRGTAPTLDVVLTLTDGRLIAIESKFTEWMTRRQPKLGDFREKYLPPGRLLWADAGFPACQALAGRIGDGEETFRYLDALQLLKHALGLAVSARQPFVLRYVYYDVTASSEIAARHREEIGRFAGQVDAALGFEAMSYQRLLAALATAEPPDPGYVRYLAKRYFPGEPAGNARATLTPMPAHSEHGTGDCQT